MPGGRWVVGLPGNPFAALAGALTLLDPLLAKCAGRGPARNPSARIEGEVRPHATDTRLVAVAWSGCPHGLSATTVLRLCGERRSRTRWRWFHRSGREGSWSYFVCRPAIRSIRLTTLTVGSLPGVVALVALDTDLVVSKADAGADPTSCCRDVGVLRIHSQDAVNIRERRSERVDVV